MPRETIQNGERFVTYKQFVIAQLSEFGLLLTMLAGAWAVHGASPHSGAAYMRDVERNQAQIESIHGDLRDLRQDIKSILSNQASIIRKFDQ